MNANYPSLLTVRLWAHTCLLLVLGLASLRAGPDEERVLRLREQIQTLSEVIGKTDKGAEKARLEIKLQRMQQELAILDERTLIEQKQLALAAELPASPLAALRERLRNLEFTVETSAQRIQEINTKRRALAAERDAVHQQLSTNGASANQATVDERSKGEEVLFTLNERLRDLALQREAEDARLELAREADRLREVTKSLETNRQPNLRHLIEAYNQMIAGDKTRAQLTNLIEGVQNNLRIGKLNYELGQQKVAKFDEELTLLEKQTGFFRSNANVVRLLAIQRGQKQALVERLPILRSQVDSLEATARALLMRAELIDLERAAQEELFDDLRSGYLVRLYWPALGIGGIILLYGLAHYVVLPAFYRKENLLLARRLARYTWCVVATGIVAGFLFEDLTMVAATLGVVSAALVIALQDVCTSVAGWFVIMLGGKFTIGDRLEIDGSTGDVIDIQLLRTTLIEVGQWMETDHPTGRVIVIPNNFIFKGKVFNFSHHHSFVWDQIVLTLAFTTPVAEALAVFHRALAEETLEEFSAAQAEADRFRKKYGVDDAVYSPRISTAITGDGVVLRLLFVAHYRRLSAVRNRIHRRLIRELEVNPKIQLANTTYNILHAPMGSDSPAAIMGDQRDMTSRPPFGFPGTQAPSRPPILPGR